MVGTDLAVLGTNFECGRKVHDLFVDRVVVGLVRELFFVWRLLVRLLVYWRWTVDVIVIWPDCFIFGCFSVIGSGKIEPEKIT